MRIPIRFEPHFAIGIQVGGLVLGLICNLLLARVLGSDGYGEYAVAYNLVTIISVPLDVGLAMVMVREISRYHAMGDWAHLRGAIIASLAVTIGFTVPCALVLVLCVAFNGNELASYAPILLWSIALLPIGSLVTIRSSILRGLGAPLKGQLLSSVVRPGILVLLLSTTILYKFLTSADMDISASFAMFLHIIAAAFALLMSFFIMSKSLQKACERVHPVFLWKQWLSDIPGFSLMAAALVINQAMGSFILAYYHSASDVGIYRIAELCASLVAMPLGAMAIHYSRDISNFIASKNLDALRNTLKMGAKIALYFALPIFFLYALFGQQLLKLFLGDKFIAAWFPMLILSVGQVGNAFAGLVGITMSMGGHHRESLMVVLVAIALQFMLSMLLIPAEGIYGAALASSFSTLFWSQLLRFRVKRLYGISSLAV